MKKRNGAKAQVMQRRYRLQVVKDRTKYSRKQKHKNKD